jgi:hypothetical protein
VRELYGEVPFSQRQYTAIVDGQSASGIADNVAVIDGKNVAVEAKFLKGVWGNLLRNPRSPIGTRSFSREERRDLVAQAGGCVAVFDEVVYHSNGEGFIQHYTGVFRRLKPADPPTCPGGRSLARPTGCPPPQSEVPGACEGREDHARLWPPLRLPTGLEPCPRALGRRVSGSRPCSGAQPVGLTNAPRPRRPFRPPGSSSV